MDEPFGDLIHLWTTAAGYRIHARVSASSPSQHGPPVVLVHGLGVSGTYMVPTALRLARHYPVLLPDLPGFGRSERPKHVLNMAGLADALIAWTRALGIQRAAYLANSMGCQITAQAVVRHPEAVGRLVLTGPTVDSHGRTWPRQILRLFRDSLREPPSLVSIIARDYLLSAGLPYVIRTFRYALADPLEAHLPHIDVPTLLVRGERDMIAPQRWIEELARQTPCGRVAVLPGAPHAVNFSAPDALVRVVRPFLDGDNSGLDRTTAIPSQ